MSSTEKQFLRVTNRNTGAWLDYDLPSHEFTVYPTEFSGQKSALNDDELLSACRTAIWMRFAVGQDMEPAMWLALHERIKARLVKAPT